MITAGAGSGSPSSESGIRDGSSRADRAALAARTASVSPGAVSASRAVRACDSAIFCGIPKITLAPVAAVISCIRAADNGTRLPAAGGLRTSPATPAERRSPERDRDRERSADRARPREKHKGMSTLMK